jgi:hypothetical protein
MPQLDINAFIYQYVGIIILLIIIYTTLSYIVLPILLRLMLIRNAFLLTQKKLTDILQLTAPTYQHLLVSKRPLYINFLLNNIILHSVNTIKNLLNFLNCIVANLTNLAVISNNKNGTLFLHEFTLSYLILLLAMEIEEVNE